MSSLYLKIERQAYDDKIILQQVYLQFYVTAKDISFSEEEMRNINRFFELPLGQYASTYSTGMLKKLYLLGILLQQNDILILDEPFNGLDFKSSAFVTALIVNLREEGHTIFVASHDIDHLLSYSDTLTLLKDKTIEFYPDKESFKRVEDQITGEAMVKVGEMRRSMIACRRD